MSATATLPMPPASSVGLLPYMTAPKKQKGDEPQTKHSFDSDAKATAILHKVLQAGANKTRFINLCIEFAAAQAFRELAVERKRAEQEFWRIVETPNRGSKKPSVPSE